jgi:hypothetical protein
MVREILFGMLASTMSQAAEPAKLVLACQGHTHYLGAGEAALDLAAFLERYIDRSAVRISFCFGCASRLMRRPARLRAEASIRQQALFDRHVLTLGITDFAQPAPQCCQERLRSVSGHIGRHHGGCR